MSDHQHHEHHEHRHQHQQSRDERTVDPEDRDAQPLDAQQDAETDEDTASGGAPQPPA